MASNASGARLRTKLYAAAAAAAIITTILILWFWQTLYVIVTAVSIVFGTLSALNTTRRRPR